MYKLQNGIPSKAIVHNILRAIHGVTWKVTGWWKKKKKKKEEEEEEEEEEEGRKHFDRLVTFWFSTFAMLFHTTRVLVRKTLKDECYIDIKILQE